MFCPKCGKEITAAIKYCPRCGTAIEKKPAEDLRQKEAAVTRSRGIDGKKLLLPLVALVVAVIIVLGAVSLLQPRLKEEEARELISDYFEESEDYSKNKAQYEACFRYTVNDLTRQLSERLTSMLDSLGVDISGVDMDSLARQIGNTLSDYFSSNSSNQISLAEAILEKSSYKIGKIKKEDGIFNVEVTVTSVDIGEINQLLIDDSINIPGFVKLAMQFAFGGKGGFLGNLTDMAGGDISFVLDSFVSKAKTAGGKNSYTGIMEFQYDKETKAWEISSVDSKLLDVYFGIN